MIKRLVAAAALCITLPAFADNLVTDGSFESALMPLGTWTFYSGTSLYGWTSSSGAGDNIEIRHNAIGTAEQGEYFAELDSENHDSGMTQSLNTVAGQTYTLSFWYSNRAQNDTYNLGLPGGIVPASSNGLTVDIGTGAVAVPAVATNTTSDNVWQHYTRTFVATGTTTLSFQAIGTSDTLGTSIDNISVTSAVPEPASLALMASGLLLVGGLGRRRTNRRS